jgi:periplasmic copper chaperone A
MRRTALRALGAAVLGVALTSAAFASDIAVEQPFARASAGAVTAGAAFMTLKNSGASDDALIAVSTPVAEHAELHIHIKDGDVMRMREVESIDVPAGSTVMLQPGGLHVMLIDLKAPLKAGEQFPLTLTFEKAGAMTIEVPVKSIAAMAPMHDHKQ